MSESLKNYSESLNAGFFETIKRYFLWQTPIITGIPGNIFIVIILVTISNLVYKIIRKKPDAYQELSMFLVLFVATLSWVILAKAHSYSHTHINYVLWYFGFIQMCFYIIIQSLIKSFFKCIPQSASKHLQNKSFFLKKKEK